MRKKVLVAVNTAGPAGQGKLAGVFRYLGGRPDWSLTIARHPAAFTPSLVRKAMAESCDGIILATGEADASCRIVAGLDTPAVVMDTSNETLWRNRRNTFFVANSDASIGVAAADYLMSTGRCRSYAYVHFHLDRRVYQWDEQRVRAFRARLVAKGLTCHDLQYPDGIQALERPVGVFAANDEVAFTTIQYCKEHRIRVPDSALVIGVDNDTLVCENCMPQITSIQPDFERAGFIAAEALDRMMDGRRPDRAEPMLVGVKCIVRRDSSATTSHAGKMVQKALAYIRANALDGIDVGDVVRTMGCSRRLADLRFRELQDISIGQMIINVRLDEVRRRLVSTRDSIDAIANACGYSNITHLKSLFFRRFGEPMSACRPF